MTNFFERQKWARRQTWLLGLIFAMAFVSIILFTALWSSQLTDIPLITILPAISIIVLVIVITATLYRALGLKQGGSKVAQQLGATPVQTNVADLQLKRLRNVVEEIAIASGVPVPDIFVLNQERGINAFASGYSASDAAITVTRGTLDALNRDELQAVIAHEFSHIQNGDMRLNIQLVSTLFGISIIGLMGVRILRLRLRGKNSGGIYLFALGLIAIGYVGLLASRIIKAGINRQREYLADACAVQYTRQNLGLSGALKKIAATQVGSIMKNDEAAEFSHMFFSQGFPLSSLMATHPPLLSRLMILEPKLKPEEIEELKLKWSSAPPNGAEEDIALGFSAREVKLSNHIPVSADTITHHVASSSSEGFKQAKVIIEGIPEELRQAARNYYAVIPLLFALVYSRDPAIQAKQNEIIKCRHSPKTLANTEALSKRVATLNKSEYLPLAMLAFPALRQCPREKLDFFQDTVDSLVTVDDHVTLFEYLFPYLLKVQINDFLNPSEALSEGNRTIKSAAIAVSKLIAVMAQVGHQHSDDIISAYQAGMQTAIPNSNIPYEPVSHFASTLDSVWIVLDGLNPDGKELLLKGLVTAMQHDGVITLDESDLLRAACASLHIPLPLLLETT